MIRCRTGAPFVAALALLLLAAPFWATSAVPMKSGAGAARGPGRALLAAAGNGAVDYGAVLGLSYLFYEAQRSGKLPGSQRVKWRGDSALQDKGPEGQDLTGGYYDAGDYVKFNSPAAFTTAMLGWALLEFPQGIAAAGQTDNALAALRWGADYLAKCVLDENRVVSQVGEAKNDHNFWRRAEDVKETRAVAVCSPSKPASDVAAAMAGALAITALVFQKRDAGYSAQVLSKAKTAYNFANKYRGAYTANCSLDAAQFYPSKSYNDDLAWGALWLKRATGESKYLEEAKGHYAAHRSTEPWNDWRSRKYGFFWDSYSPGAALLLAQETGASDAKDHWAGFKEAWTSQKGNEHVVTSPKGYAWYIKDLGWGNLRHMGNAAFLVLIGAKAEGGAERDRLVCWAHGQLQYALGDAGRSYVVGYGPNPPVKPHHRGASCPDAPATCDYNWVNNPGANPRTIVGALVGGPDPSDIYRDDRTDVRNNEVASDYNAGYTGALASLTQAHIDYDACKAKGYKREKKG